MCNEKIENTLDVLCQYVFEKNSCLDGEPLATLRSGSFLGSN